MKNLFARKGYVVKISKYGSALVDLKTGSRKDYKGEAPHGTLYAKPNAFSRMKRMGVESNVHHLTGLHASFQTAITDAEQKAADAMTVGSWKDAYSAHRVDLTHLPTFTIDSETSRDLDDAISAVREGDSYRVWVHIADVSALIASNSRLDRGARKRLTSLYWPDGSLTMLPRNLSEVCFSLLPGKERLVFTMEFLLTDGEIVDSKLYPATITSDAKLSYTQVSSFLRGEGELPESVQSSVAAARDAIALDLTYSEETREYKFLVEEGTVVGYQTGENGPSNKLIETYMVMANTEAGKMLKESKTPGIYRVHSLVDEEKRVQALAKVNTIFPLPENCTFEEAVALVDASAHERKEVLQRFLLHTTPPACYTTVAGEHEGLAVEAYAHFTSPIRRYADLANHRQLYAMLGYRKASSPKKLQALAEALNAAFLNAKKMSRLMDDLFLNSHLESELGNGSYRGKLTATVDGFGPSGAFCSFGHGKNGFLFLDQLGPGELNEERTIFTGKYRTVTIGDEIPITVGRPDLARGRLSVRFYRDRPKKHRR